MERIKKLFNKYKEMILYLFFGGCTTLVNIIAYYICSKIGIGTAVSTVIAWVLSVLFAYITNRKYVFESKNKNIVKECLSFFLARLSTLIIDMLSMGIMVSFSKMNDSIAKIIVQFIILILNYILSKFLVFKKHNFNHSGY